MKYKREETEARLSTVLNRVPERVNHVHLTGICGTGMASLAGMFKEKGFHVTGSDQNIYPPMSNFLESLNIPVYKGYNPGNLSEKPDLVVVGNVVTRMNPEVIELSRLGLCYLSFPQAVKQFALKGKLPIVISGTHGKTTTSALVAWILEQAGLKPGFMIGGIPLNFQTNFRQGKGKYFVIEGDEYDTAFFDKGPKFLHYSPWAVILTSIEFDHADIYKDLDHVIKSFRKLITIIPEDGILIANGDDPIINAEINKARCRVDTYGLSDNASWNAFNISVNEKFSKFNVRKTGVKSTGPALKEYMDFLTPLYGRHNISNILSAVALAFYLKIDPSSLAKSIKEFSGVKRRQEIIGEKKDVLILDDFAHHPTAVRETIKAVKEKYRTRRLITVFEPRSNSSRRNIFQKQYALSFDKVDIIMIPEPVMLDKSSPSERFSSKQLVADLADRELHAIYFHDASLLLEALVKKAEPGDVILFMSNGAFDNLPVRLLESL